MNSATSATLHDGLRFRNGGHLKITSDMNIGPQFTIDLWIRPHSIVEPQIILMQQGPSENTLFIRIADSKLLFGWGPIGSTGRGICETALTDNDPSRWTRVSCVQDCADLFLFKNGLLRDTSQSSIAESFFSNEIYLGGCPEQDKMSFNGDIKDVRIFDASLTQDSVESLFSLSLAPTSTASNTHLVAHFRCDEGQFPLENSSMSPNSLAAAVTVSGSVSWLPTEGEGTDVSSVTQSEVDFTTQSDNDDLFALDLSQEQREYSSVWKAAKMMNQAELSQRVLAIEAEIQLHFIVRIMLHAVHVADIQTGSDIPGELFRKSLKLSCNSNDAELLALGREAIIRLPRMPKMGAILKEAVSELMTVIQSPQKVMSFESPHPCKSLADPPREVYAPGTTVYDMFFDQRCSTNTMLFTIYTDHTLSNVVAQFSGPALSSMRIKSTKFFFDVRIDGVGPQWGYKLNVVYDTQKQLHGMRLFKGLMNSNPSFAHLVEPSVVEGLTACAIANTGKTRRIALSCLAELIATFPAKIRPFVDSSALLEVRRMAERQFRREVGLHLHSRFVQVATEFFIILKDADLCLSSDDNGVTETTHNSDMDSFTAKRAQQRLRYSSKVRDGKERVQIEKLRYAENIRVEANADRSVAAWSERSGASFLANVALYAGSWYYEVKMVATADVTIGIISSNFDKKDGNIEQTSWGFNGKRINENCSITSALRGDQRRPKQWRGKDVIGVVVNIDAKEIQFYVNGNYSEVTIQFGSPETNSDGAASAAGDFSTSPSEPLRSVGFFPHFVLAADEGIVLNFGATHFEFEIPPNCLPLDPANLALGTLIPFNQVRAFDDVCTTILSGSMSIPPFFVDECDPFDEIAFRQGPPHASLVATEDITVNIMEARCTGNVFSTVCGNCAVTRGKWYFEVTLLTQGLMQIGWLEADAYPHVSVGDSKNSYSIDLFRRVRWHDSKAQPLTSVRRWTVGDVVGCALDLDNGKMWFSFNGRNLTDVLGNEAFFQDVRPTMPLAPAVSMRPGNGCLFNFGSSSFKHKPDGFNALGVPDTWNERIDTYYSTLGSKMATKRLEAMQKLSQAPRRNILLETLERLVKVVEEYCTDNGKIFQQLTDEIISSLPLEVSVATPPVTKLFDLLKNFARLAQVAIPLCHLDLNDNNRSTKLIRGSRGLIFSSVREPFVNYILKETNCRSEHFRLTINRAKARNASENMLACGVFGQTHELLADQHPRLFKTNKRFWSVLFLGEGAEDVGGPFREHLSEMCSELMSTKLPLFVKTANNVHNTGSHREAFIPASSVRSEFHLSMYNFVGRLMGGAIRSGEPLSLFFPPMVWKQLAHLPLEENDIECVDKMCLQCIREFRSMNDHGDDSQEVFDETFGSEEFVTLLSDGSTVELIPGGSAIPVTFHQCKLYADALAKVRLNEAREQIEAMREGLLSVVSELAVALLTHEELEFRVCGKPDYTVSELREGATYEGLTSEDRRVGLLWAALDAASPQQRRLFLRFVSGRDRMPVKVRILPMVTQGDPNCVLPRAATCFFAIELPDYSSLEVMKEKLFYTIENCADIDTDFRARDTDENDGPQLMVGIEDGRQDDADTGINAE